MQKVDIPANVILCEYRGKVFSLEEGLRVKSDKSMLVQLENNTYILVGSGVCAMINDCRDISRYDGQCHAGFARNARAGAMHGKIFVMSLRHIAAGEEIFFDYNGINGNYWA